jgi:predicted nucleic acid-binding protein
MRAVISDASPLISLAKLGHLDWLRVIYGKIVVPPAVWSEVAVDENKFPDARAIRRALAEGWAEVTPPTKAIPRAALDLGRGEREAIALAEELSAVLIIDELAGRQVAQKLGLIVTGTAGVLLTAKLRGLTKSLKGELERLEKETTFWLSSDLRADLLRQAAESE